MKKVYIFSLMAIIFIAGCSRNSPPPSILDELICEPPCWQNIIPGDTTESEVLEIIFEFDNIDRDSIFNNEVPWNSYSNYIKFRFDNYGYQVLVELYFIDGKVGLITLSDNLGVSIASAFIKLGEPKSIFIAYQQFYIPVLFNDEIGVAIFYNEKDVPNKFRGTIHPEIEIGTIGFFNPESFPQILESGVFSALSYDLEETLNRVFGWDGYGNIEEKYLP